MVGIVPHAIVDLENVVADEPDQVGEIGSSCLVRDKLQHGLVLHSVHVEGEGPDSNPDHALAMVEELDGLCVQGEVVGVLIVEEVDGVLVQPKRQRLQEGDIICHHLG